jgi:hypothetical protein
MNFVTFDWRAGGYGNARVMNQPLFDSASQWVREIVTHDHISAHACVVPWQCGSRGE